MKGLALPVEKLTWMQEADGAFVATLVSERTEYILSCFYGQSVSQVLFAIEASESLPCWLCVLFLLMNMGLIWQYYALKRSSRRLKTQTICKTARLRDQLRKLHIEHKRRHWSAISLNREYLTELVPQIESMNSQQAWLTKIAYHIRRDYGCAEFGTAAMARVLHMSERSFQRHFKQLTGTTFKHHLIECRLAYAQRYLLAGYRVTETALACGFNDPSYFSQRFRAQFGLSPTQFIEQQTEKIVARSGDSTTGANAPSPLPELLTQE